MGKSTKYTVTATNAAGEVRELGVKSKKATAMDLARAERKSTGEAVQVVTDAGTVVFEQAAKKTVKMSPRYTRVVELPEDVIVPEGKRVAYFRPRVNLAVLHDAESGDYTLLDTAEGMELEETFETTRDAGRFLVEVAAKRKTPANA